MSQHGAEPKNSAEAVRRVLTTAGITGAALTLSAAAALPALACHSGGSSKGDEKTSSSQSHSAKAEHESKGKDSDKSATKTSSEHSDSDKSKDHSNNGKSGEHKSDKGKSEGDKSQGGTTDEGHNPPGNNGTVKIHQTAGDSSPHNQPHVTCTFYVSFFGFDKNQTLNIAFTGQAPTGKGTPITITDASKRSLTSTTDAGGAGNDYDGDQGAFSASNLDLSGITPAKQGYHIKLDVSTGQGGGHKYKVFWLTPCATTPTTPGTPGTPGSPGTPGGPTGGTTESGGGTTTTGGGTVAGETGGQGTTGTSVLGETFTKGTPSSGSPSTSVLGTSAARTPAATGSLPFTGAEIGAMSALGLAAIGGGAAMTLAGRRRRRGVHAS